MGDTTQELLSEQLGKGAVTIIEDTDAIAAVTGVTYYAVHFPVETTIAAITTTAKVTVDAANIAVGGSTEPMVLGKSFMSDLMAKHTHESSVGPTTGISPSFTSKIQSSLSKKCFLG